MFLEAKTDEKLEKKLKFVLSNPLGLYRPYSPINLAGIERVFRLNAGAVNAGPT